MTYRWFYIMNNQGLCYNFRAGNFATFCLDCLADDQQYVDAYVERLTEQGHICMAITTLVHMNEIGVR